MPGEMRVDVLTVDGTVVLRVSGLLDDQAAGQLQGQLLQIGRAGSHTHRIVVDLDAADVADPDALQVLRTIDAQLRVEGVSLVLATTQPAVLDVVRRAGLDDVLNVEDRTPGSS